MNVNLSQIQRLIVAVFYTASILAIFRFLGGEASMGIWEQGNDANIWIYSGLLLIILGKYVSAPYFTKPTDALANSIAVLLALINITFKERYWGYPYVLYFSMSVLLASLLSIILKDAVKTFWKQVGTFTYTYATKLGNHNVIFSVTYISASVSYFALQYDLIGFVWVLFLWICIVFFDIIGLVISTFSKIFGSARKQVSSEIGQAIGCDNPLLYKIEIDLSNQKENSIKDGELVAIESKQNVGSLGIVVDIRHLLTKKWLSIYLLKHESGEVIKVDLKTYKLIADENSIYSSPLKVYRLDLNQLDGNDKNQVEQNVLYKKRKTFIGFVEKESNIYSVNFTIVTNSIESKSRIYEGAILAIEINDQETLYQIINGNTRKDSLENLDTHGYTIGIARKLGEYINDNKELITRKWMPNIYSPVFLKSAEAIDENRIKEIAKTAIGRLPETDFEIPIKDINGIITHNTAILGILGIGKSCLMYELVQKISSVDIKIICIDITNEYPKNLPKYIQGNLIKSDSENSFDEINVNFERIHYDKNSDQKDVANHKKSGNEEDYRKSLRRDLCQFFFGVDDIPADKSIIFTNEKVRVYNPDYHKVSQGEKIGYNVITVASSQAEKTRIISEEIFKILMKLGTTEDQRARACVIFEEAHSLIPEWNSVANEGDKSASNGTAKIILQGRKYGLGCFVVTQRTANVSKSILNQCNTIFALRVFDDTGKTFLENYIGRDYSSTLSTLEEQHAVVVGKGLRLKQPVIVQLNRLENVVLAP